MILLRINLSNFLQFATGKKLLPQLSSRKHPVSSCQWSGRAAVLLWLHCVAGQSYPWVGLDWVTQNGPMDNSEFDRTATSEGQTDRHRPYLLAYHHTGKNKQKTLYYYYYFDPGTQFPRNKKNYAMQYKKYKKSRWNEPYSSSSSSFTKQSCSKMASYR